MSVAWRVLVGMACVCIPLAGCMTRTAVVTSEPTGARVIVNEVEVGLTPCEFDFTHYGVYDALLLKDGFEPARVALAFHAPWYELPPFDLAANAIPTGSSGGGAAGGVHTIRSAHVVLTPVGPLGDEQSERALVERARALRDATGSN